MIRGWEAVNECEEAEMWDKIRRRAALTRVPLSRLSSQCLHHHHYLHRRLHHHQAVMITACTSQTRRESSLAALCDDLFADPLPADRHGVLTL